MLKPRSISDHHVIVAIEAPSQSIRSTCFTPCCIAAIFSTAQTNIVRPCLHFYQLRPAISGFSDRLPMTASSFWLVVFWKGCTRTASRELDISPFDPIKLVLRCCWASLAHHRISLGEIDGCPFPVAANGARTKPFSIHGARLSISLYSLARVERRLWVLLDPRSGRGVRQNSESLGLDSLQTKENGRCWASHDWYNPALSFKITSMTSSAIRLRIQ